MAALRALASRLRGAAAVTTTRPLLPPLRRTPPPHHHLRHLHRHLATTTTASSSPSSSQPPAAHDAHVHQGRKVTGEFTIRDFPLQRGGVLPRATLSYATYGARGAPCILHPTSFDARHGDLEYAIGPGRTLDTDKYFVVVPVRGCAGTCVRVWSWGKVGWERGAAGERAREHRALALSWHGRGRGRVHV
jgi:hypothetical protein